MDLRYGDLLKVVDNTSNHQFEIGEILRYSNKFIGGRYKCETLSGTDFWFLQKNEFEILEGRKLLIVEFDTGEILRGKYFKDLSEYELIMSTCDRSLWDDLDIFVDNGQGLINVYYPARSAIKNIVEIELKLGVKFEVVSNTYPEHYFKIGQVVTLSGFNTERYYEKYNQEVYEFEIEDGTKQFINILDVRPIYPKAKEEKKSRSLKKLKLKTETYAVS